MNILLTCVSVIETNQRNGYFHVKIMKNLEKKNNACLLRTSIETGQIRYTKQSECEGYCFVHF